MIGESGEFQNEGRIQLDFGNAFIGTSVKCNFQKNFNIEASEEQHDDVKIS